MALGSEGPPPSASWERGRKGVRLLTGAPGGVWPHGAWCLRAHTRLNNHRAALFPLEVV